jgi:hypothetical protein
MNESQRGVLVWSLFIVAGLFLGLIAIAIAGQKGGGETWWLLVPPVAIVAALYLRAGRKKD